MSGNMQHPSVDGAAGSGKNALHSMQIAPISPFTASLIRRGGDLVYEDLHWAVFLDGAPVRPGHLVVVPKREFSSYFEIRPDEWSALNDVLRKVPGLVDGAGLAARYRDMLSNLSPGVSEQHIRAALESPHLSKPRTDFTIAIDEGERAGQRIPHLQIHFVPRFSGDVADPGHGFKAMFPGYAPHTATSLGALTHALAFYGNENLALQYFRQIREARGVMPFLSEFLEGVEPGPENRIGELGFGPGVELEEMLRRGHHIDGVDISVPMHVQLQRILDKKAGAVPRSDPFAWRDYVRLFPYALQEFPIQKDHYARVWSSATFLHLDRHEIAPVLNTVGASLKRPSAGRPEPLVYVNFKLGESNVLELDSQGRPFSYFTEASFREEIMPHVEELRVKKIWVPEGDALGRSTRWLNILLAPRLPGMGKSS